MRSSGSLMILGSAAAFGTMAIFGKLAYDEGATAGTLLAVRFTLAAVLSWAVLAARRAPLRIGRRDVAIAFALGAVGYAAQAGGFFLALERIDASLLSLLLYSYPAMVAVAAVAIGRERLTPRRVAALTCTSAGLALVLAGAGTGALDPVGAALGLGAALVYTAYILVSEGVSGRLAPPVLSAIVCTGAAVTLTGGAAATGELQLGALTAPGWGWLAALAVVSSVIAISLFFAGLHRVGPTRAAILSTFEPVVTVALAALAFGELLTLVQLAGGALVLAGVLVLNLRPTALRSRARPLRPAPAGSSAHRG